MRIAFMGTPVFAATALSALIKAGKDVACVYTQPPRPANRGKSLTKSPVHVMAEEHGFIIRTPERLKAMTECAAFAALDLDVAVVAAYGLILPQAILDTPRRGCINIHASLLPRWRGAAPIHRAIMAGDATTGITIMQMETGLDTGPMLLARSCVIAETDTTGSLHNRLAHMGGDMIVEALATLDSIQPVGQPEYDITYAHKIEKTEARLDFTKPAAALERLIRAMQPAPGAWFEYGGERIKVIAAVAVSASDATCGDVIGRHLTIVCAEHSALQPTIVQRAGRAPVTTAELLRGFPIPAGTHLA